MSKHTYKYSFTNKSTRNGVYDIINYLYAIEI